ncbi:MAG: DNA-binding protein [Nitrospirota bacterium]
MKTLFLAWQDKRLKNQQEAGSRAWFPIGRLEVEEQDTFYRFTYLHGALMAQEKAGFQPLDAFPNLHEVYESGYLFPLFQNRLMSPKREDYAEYLQRLDLSPGTTDPFEILAISGGGRQTDNLEVFPKIQTRRDGSFSCRFFLHGWRHVNSASQQRLNNLDEGELLQVCLELNNPATGTAIQLQTTKDYFILGWAPRYLIKDVLAAVAQDSVGMKAHVVRYSPPPAPRNQRVLVELSGRFEPGYEPMSGQEFLLLHPVELSTARG